MRTMNHLKRLGAAALTLALAGSLSFAAGCDGGADPDAATAEEMAESTPDLSDLQLDDATTAQAGLATMGLAVGDVAQIYTAQKQLRDDLNHPLKRIADRLKELAQTINKSQCGKRYCDFEKDGDGGVHWTLRVFRVNGANYGWVLTGDNGTVTRVGAWGFFHKTAPRRGVVKAVFRFTQLNELNPNYFKATGRLAVKFNNVTPIKRIRLFALELDRTGNGETVTAGFGFARHKTEGYGRFRFAVRADMFDEVAGKEILLGRARWNGDHYGRGDAALIDPANKKLVGTYHECWDDAFQILWAKKVVGGETTMEVGTPTDCGQSLDTDETPDASTLGAEDDDPETAVEDIDLVPDAGDEPPTDTE